MSRSSIPIVAPSPPPMPQQARVLEHAAGALLVTGGAGTGKTAVLRERFARLVEAGADPERVVLVVGSAAARDESRDLAARTVPGVAPRPAGGDDPRAREPRPASGAPPALGYDRAAAGARRPPSSSRRCASCSRRPGPRQRGRPTGTCSACAGSPTRSASSCCGPRKRCAPPSRSSAAAERRGLTGWHELARFLGEYQEVLDDLNVGRLRGAAPARGERPPRSGEPLFDHVLVDDYQDTTLAPRRCCGGRALARPRRGGRPRRARLLVPGHESRAARSVRRASTSVTWSSPTNHRAPEAVTVEAWVAPHTSEEHARGRARAAAAARGRRRRRGTTSRSWFAARARTSAACCARSTTRACRARCPSAALSLTAEPATLPYVLALRWLVADERAARGARSSSCSSPTWSGCRRPRRAGCCAPRVTSTGSIARALDVEEGLTAAEAEAVATAREVLAKAALFAGMSVQDAFKVLWEELPCSAPAGPRRPATPEARRDLDTVVTFANVVAEASEDGDTRRGGVPRVARRRRARPRLLGVGAVAPRRRAGADRPRRGRPRVRHGARRGRGRGQLPAPRGPSRCSTWRCSTGRSHAERNRERLEDERRLFHMVLGRARRRVVLACADAHPDAHADADELLVALAVRRRRPASRGGPRPRGRSTIPCRCARPARRGVDSSPTRSCRRGGGSRPSTAWSRSASTRRAGGSSATGPTPAGRCTRRSACRTRACRTSRPAS